jgi:hypothetical protein
METPFDFFIVSKQYLEIDDIDPNVQHVFDKIASQEFYKAIATIANKYNIDYLTARGYLIEIQRSQSTVNLSGICRHVFEGENWAASQFTSRLAQNANLEI